MAVICQFNAFFLVVFMFSSQGDSRLLDPTLLAQELETFANDGLGVKEMQVRALVLPGTIQIYSIIKCCRTYELVKTLAAVIVTNEAGSNSLRAA